MTGRTKWIDVRHKVRAGAAGSRHDNRATSQIGAAGWVLTRVGNRYVASKRVIEDDHTITMKYESSYVLSDLARHVQRREREAA